MPRKLLAALVSLALGCGGAVGGGPVALAQPAPQTASPLDEEVAAAPPSPQKRAIDRDGAPVEPADAHQVDATLASRAAPEVPGLAAPPSPGAPASPLPPSATQLAATAPREGLLLVYTARVTMAVYRVEPALDAVERAARDLGGYLASRNDAEIRVRVPRARFDEALKRVEASGDVLHREIAAEDVTARYVDTAARLKNARAVRDRLEELLAKASVKEAIDIQRELERVTGEIESLEGALALLSNRVAYSTIDVRFQARAGAAVGAAETRLPFPWLRELGLPRLLDLGGTP